MPGRVPLGCRHGHRHPGDRAAGRGRLPHTLHPYEHDPRAEAYGEEAAAALGVDPGRIFKTLIASVDGKLVCAVVPVAGGST